jgi:hypothetical protein
MARRVGYERDDDAFPADAYTVRRHGGVAWHVHGWETQPTEETEWSGFEERTGYVVCTMVGDDSRWTFDPDDLTPLEREEYCGECGQIGCGREV